MMTSLVNRAFAIRVLAAVLTIGAVCACTDRAYSQRHKEGDEIEVFVLREWRPAVVQSGPVRHAENMRVDSNGGLAKGGVQDHIGRLATNAGK